MPYIYRKPRIDMYFYPGTIIGIHSPEDKFFDSPSCTINTQKHKNAASNKKKIKRNREKILAGTANTVRKNTMSIQETKLPLKDRKNKKRELNIFICCNKLFKSKAALKRHRLICECNRLQCPKCKKIFNSNYELNMHIRIDHNNTVL